MHIFWNLSTNWCFHPAFFYTICIKIGGWKHCDWLHKGSKNQYVKLHMIFCFYVAETPIEEFTPTPAFPALQYLESVDVEGVAWRAGLRTGDFLIEV